MNPTERETGAAGAEGADAGAMDEGKGRADASRRNRAALLWITIACLALAAAGYAFAHWMIRQPPPPPGRTSRSY
ncbi:MAG TPA: hypothetical protein VF363_02685 [Candidatus Eisenbacteria bacterium]